MFGSATIVCTEVGEFLSIFSTSFNNLEYEKVAGGSDAPNSLVIAHSGFIFHQVPLIGLFLLNESLLKH
jgi:hypothetical protein